jgi:hypothetical protein
MARMLLGLLPGVPARHRVNRLLRVRPATVATARPFPHPASIVEHMFESLARGSDMLSCWVRQGSDEHGFPAGEGLVGSPVSQRGQNLATSSPVHE